MGFCWAQPIPDWPVSALACRAACNSGCHLSRDHRDPKKSSFPESSPEILWEPKIADACHATSKTWRIFATWSPCHPMDSSELWTHPEVIRWVLYEITSLGEERNTFWNMVENPVNTMGKLLFHGFQSFWRLLRQKTPRSSRISRSNSQTCAWYEKQQKSSGIAIFKDSNFGKSWSNRSSELRWGAKISPKFSTLCTTDTGLQNGNLRRCPPGVHQVSQVSAVLSGGRAYSSRTAAGSSLM